MVKYNIKYFFWLIIGLFVFLYVGLALLQCSSFDEIEIRFSENITWVKNISYALTIEVLISLLFVKFFWKCKIFCWVVPVPCLSGKWTGSIVYEYEGHEIHKPVELTIKQDFFHVVVKLKTDESSSISVASQFDIDKDRDIKCLIYSYRNEPKIEFRDRSPIHYGSVKLNISDDNKELSGEYWTDRKSVGSMKLVKV